MADLLITIPEIGNHLHCFECPKLGHSNVYAPEYNDPPPVPICGLFGNTQLKTNVRGEAYRCNECKEAERRGEER